jgi:hypothetical protein
MTLSLSKVNYLMDSCGKTFKVEHDSSDTFKYDGDDESIATYCRVRDLLNKGVEIDFIQYPHGSWSSNDGKNTNKRDEKRADIYYTDAVNGEEGKTKLSDVYKHIQKYGLIHDRYYYLIEDCDVNPLMRDKFVKVIF